ncbi:NAD-specific glutamate dehydrogenase [bacterium BMS3Bbin10]|nr:NAD-specific glutamate dehydrogenase [bacterium BMS3Bbin10]
MSRKPRSNQQSFVKSAIKSINGSGKIGTALAGILLEELQDSDLEGMTLEAAGTLVRSALEFSAERAPDKHKLRVYNPDGPASALGDVTIVEILNNDMPFLVDSVMGEIQERPLRVNLILHPILRVTRDKKNRLKTVSGPKDPAPEDAVRESYIQVHITRLHSKAQRKELEAALDRILRHVCIVVGDWRPMLQRAEEAVAAYTAAPPSIPVADLAESIQFLKWLLDENFTFLGMRTMTFVGGKKAGRLKPVAESSLGILRDRDVYVLKRGVESLHTTPEIRKFFLGPDPLIITKANVRSTVHRRTYMDYIGVKIYGDNDEISGELRIVGLFTSTAYTRSTRKIPFLRQKVEMVLGRSGYAPNSHSGKALMNVLETFPRDELFQIGVDQLFYTATGIQALDLRPRPRAFARLDGFDRFVSVIVFVPRDRFTTAVRRRIGEFMAEAYKGRLSAFYPFFPEGPLVRIHYIIGRYEGKTPVHEQAFLDENIERIIRTWEDQLADELDHAGSRISAALSQKYHGAFSAAYQTVFSPERAVRDIAEFEALGEDSPVAVKFYRADGDRPNRIHIALYHLHGPIPLSRRVPVLENMGFSVIDERSYPVVPAGDEEAAPMSHHDMLLEHSSGGAIDLKDCGARLEACFLAVWRGLAGSDGFNKLVLSAELDWREAAVIRAYGSYLRQIGTPFGQVYLAETMLRHAQVSRDLISMFRTLFDPASGKSPDRRRAAVRPFIAAIEAALDGIPSLDEDRIIRHYLNLIQSTLRTNFYQKGPDGNPLPAISFKFDSANVEGSPQPRPVAEIFVFATEVEGVHLRGGRIARGGLRWSDRAQDFRTEVLGLAKAQQVKNVVIVPAGSKGGFVPKYLSGAKNRDEFMKIGIAAYQRFIKNLLLLTDNLDGNKVIPPKDTVRYDDDDPYLVVAADKGTATFSDFANEISINHGFWLGDAFASGGSVGYDHKKMGITARGGWESVKRHFREMDRDIQSSPFSVIGIGDMSGDVFGNGMLLSKQTRLIVAFDHRDIFIDPDPDPAASWKERKRLFGMGRSSWQDYNAKLISAGGGIFPRAAKSIRLNAQIKALSGLDRSEVTPNELIHALLKGRFDLLWFGGIGTYVGGAAESDEQIGDRANDSIRVKAHELNVKVIGEGANLGMTQEARIEFARAGGRVNTDAIDNSAGVNSSDQEVNIKIAMGAAIAAGKLTLEQRNKFLPKMTGEVAEACLENNYLQSLAISLGQRHGVSDLGFQARLMRSLEGSGLLDRALEFLPDDAEIAERQASGEGLCRPELAVLLAYAKIDLFNELVASKVPDDPYFTRELESYFPKTLLKNYREEIISHRLRREIIATQLTNAIINRGGASMASRLKDMTGLAADDVVLAFTAVQGVFGLEGLFEKIDRLDNKLPGEAQLDLYLRVQDLVRAQTAWFMHHVSFAGGLTGVIELYRSQIGQVSDALKSILSETQMASLKSDQGELADAGVPASLARSLAELRFLADGPDMTIVAQSVKRPVAEIAKLHFDTGAYFRLNEFKTAGENLLVSDYFDRLAINSAIGAISDAQRAIVEDVVRAGKGGKGGFEAWLKANAAPAERTRRALDEILDGGEATLARLMVAVGHLRKLCPG